MPFSDPTWTELELSGIGVVPYSCRGVVQTLEPIDQAGANIYRDVNGTLHALGVTSFQKYKSTISCTDQRPVALDGVWIGKVVTVSCVAHLSYPTSSGSMPQRSVVSGSSFEEGDWTFYRPQLTMMVTAFSTQTDEYGAEVSWTMSLEEV